MKNTKPEANKTEANKTDSRADSRSDAHRSGEGRVVERRYKEVFVVEEVPGRRARWTKVGVAFENRDGSWNLRLSAVPVAGNKLHIRDPEPKVQADEAELPVAA